MDRKVYISRQQARSFGALCYSKAKVGYKLLVTWHGGTYWLGYVQPHGFYLEAYELQSKGNAHSLAAVLKPLPNQSWRQYERFAG